MFTNLFNDYNLSYGNYQGCNCQRYYCQRRCSPYFCQRPTVIQGPRGPQGPVGPQGASASVTVGFATSSGAVTSGSSLPLTQVVNTTSGDIVISGSVVTLAQGTYLITYSGVVTGVTGTPSISIYQNGSEITSSLSTETLTSETDLATLTNQTVVVATAQTTIDLRNNSTVDFTVDNLTITIVKLA